MAKSDEDAKRLAGLVRDLIIVQLGLAGVGIREIRNVVGGDANRITKICKQLRKALKEKEARNAK